LRLSSLSQRLPIFVLFGIFSFCVSIIVFAEKLDYILICVRCCLMFCRTGNLNVVCVRDKNDGEKEEVPEKKQKTRTN
jgi:hypothetical protein